MGRKNDLLQEIKKMILKKIYELCNDSYDGQCNIVLDVDFSHEEEIISCANFDVSVELMESGKPATVDYPATPDIVRFRLTASDINYLVGTRGNELTNLKNALNDLLVECENQILYP